MTMSKPTSSTITGSKRSLNQISDASTANPDTNPDANPDANTSTNTNTNTDDTFKYVELPFYGEHKRAVSAVAFAPSLPTAPLKKNTYALCASASADGTVQLWDIKKKDVTGFLSSISTPSSSEIDESKSKNQRNRNHCNWMTPVVCLTGHSRGVNDISWSPRTAEIIATASDDKTLRLFDVTRSSSHSILDSSPSASATASASASSSSPMNTNTNANNNNNTNNQLSWQQNNKNAKTMEGETLVEFKGHSNFCFSVKFSPQGNLLVSGSFDETVKIWDVRSGECVATLPAHSDPVTGVDFNRDGTCIVSSSHDGLIRIWDVATGECLKTIYAEGNPPVTFVKYSPNGKFVLSGMLDHKLRLWNVMGKFASPLDASGGGLNNTRNNNTGLGISTTQGRGGQCTKTYSGHVNSKYCIFSAFNVSNPKRQSIVTGSEDGNVYIYDLQTRALKQVLENAHIDACLAVAAHDTKEILASGGMSNDKTVRFWIPSPSSYDEQ